MCLAWLKSAVSPARNNRQLFQLNIPHHATYPSRHRPFVKQRERFGQRWCLLSDPPSSMHALAAFVVTGLTACSLGGATSSRKQMSVPIALLLSIVVADAVFSLSFRVRGFHVEGSLLFTRENHNSKVWCSGLGNFYVARAITFTTRRTRPAKPWVLVILPRGPTFYLGVSAPCRTTANAMA